MVPKKILFCADFSENSKHARAVAIVYAKAFGASLVVLNVINTRMLKHPALVDLHVYDVAFKEVEETARANLAAVGEECREEISDVTIQTKIGIPANEIVQFAEEQSVDLIIMGTHGRTGFSHLLLGSNAETVVRTAKCPVLTVRS
jgi:universal stress protein A